MHAPDRVLRAQHASVEEAAAAEAESVVCGDDDEEASAENDVTSVTSNCQARAALRRTTETSYSTHPAGRRRGSTGAPTVALQAIRNVRM